MARFNKKALGKSLLFVFILFLLILISARILDDAGKMSWAAMENIHSYPDSYDVCFLGPSTAMVNVSNQELYEQYGIAGISLAEPLQPMYLARYTLEEMLNYQSPQVVFFDVSPMFYSEEVNRNWTQERQNYILGTFLDGIETFDVRWNAFREIQRYNEKIRLWDYLRINYTHENWKNIVRRDQGEEGGQEHATGNGVLLGNVDVSMNASVISERQRDRIFNVNAEKYLYEMIEICNRENTELILLSEKVFGENEHNVVAELAEKYGIKFLDINEHIEEIGFSYQEDLADFSHFNLSGAIKWTDFLGAYLSENYEIVDKRNDPAYRRYEEQKSLFAQQKASLSSPTFHEYLSELAELDKTENVIFISVYDEATHALSYSDCEYLKALGLETDLREQYRGSYAAVIYGSEVQEEFALEDSVKIEGNIGSLYYKVMSGGLLSGNKACIELNDVDYMQKGRGFNLVIYNLQSGEVKDSVYFDTYADSNPRQGMEMNKDFQNQKAEFPEGTFHEYLSELAELDTSENIIFISVYDEATNSLSDTDIAMLKGLGLDTDLRGQSRCSYAAVIHDSEIQEKFSLEDTVAIVGKMKDLSYKVISGGLSSGGEAHIVLDNTDYIQRGRGFNFVIYNLDSGQVTDSVYFDTYADENPYQEREITIFEEKNDLFQDGTFRGYLIELTELNTSEKAVFISVYDEATNSLERLDIALMNELGLKTDLRGQNRCSYAAVIYDSEVEEGFSLEEAVTLEGAIDNLTYKVKSGGLSSGQSASIELNGVECIQNGRGFNFVIYNLRTGKVEESVYFDTYANVNPSRETISVAE